MPDFLPRVLAGPIVRRVELTNCSFWVATSVPATVTATIWLNTRDAGATPGTIAGGGAAAGSSAATALRKFGENLFAGVVTITLSGGTPPLTPGLIYSYDLTFSGDFGTTGLRQEGLLRDETGARLAGVDDNAPRQLALGYLENRLPSFVAPPATVDKLKMAHASCRKPHGPLIDALSWLDDEIADNFNEAESRVQQLYLTGDQIYADDVGASLLPMLTTLGQDLIGRTRVEQLPAGGSSTAATVANFPAMRRNKLVRQTAGMTTTSGDSHLLSFGEYAAMYLAVWSPRVWRQLSGNDALFVAAPAALKSLLTDWEACDQFKSKPNPLTAWRDAKKDGVDKQREAIAMFRDVVPKVARALANTATYMIFDDHEVTDDWNLNKRWRNSVFSKPLGKAIVRNAMMAYAIFQGWGNDPAEFGKGNNKKFLDETQKILGVEPASSAPFPVGATDAIDELAGATEVGADKRPKWHYTIPGPRHLVVVLDTRTHRTFQGEGIMPPNLLGGSLDKQLAKGPLTDGRELLFVVSAVPVLGPQLIETLGAPILSIVGDVKYGIVRLQKQADDPCNENSSEIGVEKADAESWVLNDEAREQLLARLATYGRAVILSGDVHYGLTLRMDYWLGTSSSSIPIVQLTSSPSHNRFKALVEALLRSNALLQRYQEGLPPELLAWNSKNPLTLPGGASISPGRRARLRRSPAMIPTRGWPAGTAFAAGKQPDWRWRIMLVADTRSNAQLPPDSPRPPDLMHADITASNPVAQVAAYRAVAARHQIAIQTDNFVLVRRIVFTNNLGLVDVTQSSGNLQLRHTLLSRSATPPFSGVANTVHVTPLAATSEPTPTLQTES